MSHVHNPCCDESRTALAELALARKVVEAARANMKAWDEAPSGFVISLEEEYRDLKEALAAYDAAKKEGGA